MPTSTNELGERLESVIVALEPSMFALTQALLAFDSVSGREGPLTRYVQEWACANGFATDLWQADEATLGQYALSRARHIPLAGRPTLVVNMPGTGNGRSLMFNAHADVVDAPQPEQWRYPPWSGTQADGRFYGRGACDVKGPMVSALWAMLALKQVYPAGLSGSVSLEVIPGEEDCVGLGTLTSLARGHRADAIIILEPTESQPRCASRGGCRFEVACIGKAVHGTVKWLGLDAIQSMRQVLEVLAELEQRWNERAADPLFTPYPIVRPITVDAVHGGRWQGMVCDACSCAGYLELLPEDDLDYWKTRFSQELSLELQQRGIGRDGFRLLFSEEYVGHRTPISHPLCRLAERITIADPKGSHWNGWAAFNSGCEAGLRASLDQTATLVWGPGSLAQAHTVDEFVAAGDIGRVARQFAQLMLHWANGTEDKITC